MARARLMCRGGASSIPKKLANLGHRFCHLIRSLLVMLKAWFAHFGSVAIHSTAFLVECGIGSRLARKAERQPQCLADVRIDSDRQSQVHRSSRGESADRVRTPDRPRPALSFLELFEKVLLIVIEIRRHVPRIVLLGRSLVGTEVVSVPPGALREMNMLEQG